MSGEKVKVKFVFTKSDDYKVIYVNGVFGGLTGQGEICANFFFESPSLPTEQDFVVDEGKLGKETPSDKSAPIVINRDLKVCIVLRPETARAISQWLDKKVNIAEGKRLKKEKVDVSKT